MRPDGERGCESTLPQLLGPLTTVPCESHPADRLCSQCTVLPFIAPSIGLVPDMFDVRPRDPDRFCRQRRKLDLAHIVTNEEMHVPDGRIAKSDHI